MKFYPYEKGGGQFSHAEGGINSFGSVLRGSLNF